MELRLTAEQAAELRAMISVALTELRSEIHHTDAAEFRERLRDRERRLVGVQTELARGEKASEQ